MKIIRYIRKDWPLIPIGVFLMAGYIIPFLDFIPVEKQAFHPFWRVIAALLFITGGFIEIKVRMQLVRKANFPGFQSTKLLQIVKDQRLVTTGMFRYIRHPLYIGRSLLSFGWVIFFSSLSGILLMAIALLFILPRIQIEEAMLIEKFGNAYRDYQKTTWRLIPYIY